MMDSTEDLEIICNLQWHSSIVRYNHGEQNYTGTSGVVIGMYDTPETTLNWSTFKSYLLKNSGIARDLGDAFEISYYSKRGEVFVSSQKEFQIALYEFRRRARMGLIVKLNVIKIPEERMKHSNDVETQCSTCCNSRSPPDWFINYMNQFKKEILEDVTCSVSGIIMNLKPNILPQIHIRKPKAERLKKIRKPDIDGDHGTQEELKSLKIEGKLNRKLENLEHKTKKLIEKKLALLTKSSGTEEEESCSRIQGHPQRESEPEEVMSLLNAAAINKAVVPHMVGGETYTHEWQVINCGKIPWTEATSLVYTWGSKELIPVYDIIPAPLLKPGEVGTITALIRIPFIAGQYECYWHFHHKKHRFGQWLGCQVVVDPFDLRGNKSVLQITDPKSRDLASRDPTSRLYAYKINEDNAYSRCPVKLPGAGAFPTAADKLKAATFYKQLTENTTQKVVGDFKVVDVKSQSPIDSNCSSDDDNQSIISVTESTSSKGLAQDYVVVPIPECFKIDANSSNSSTRSTIVDVDAARKRESGEKTFENFDDNNNSEENSQNSKESLHKPDEASSSSSCKSEIVMVTFPKSCENTEEFDIVMIDGQKVAVPKSLMNAGCLPTDVESKENFIPGSSNYTHLFGRPLSEALSPEPSLDSMPNLEPNNDLSHCSAAGSCFSEVNNTDKITKRMFMFPEDCPGFEVVNSEDKPTEVKNTVEKYEKVSWFPEDGPGYAVANSGPLNHPGCLFSAPVSKQPTNKTVGSQWFDGVQNPFGPSVQQVIPNQPKDLQISPINVSSTVCETPRSMSPELDLEAACIRTISEQLPDLPQQASAPIGTRRVPVSELVKSTAADSILTAAELDSVKAACTELENQVRDVSNTVHILPETLVNGAVSVASSAFHTARSVINRIVPQEVPNSPNDGPQQPEQCITWTRNDPTSPREINLRGLAEMGFWNRELNNSLLERFNDDVSRAIEYLVR